MSGRGGGGCPGGEALSAFLDRETEGPWHEAIARHLRGCQRCREQLGRLERLRELLAKDPAPEPRSSLATLRQRLAQAGRGLAWRLPFWRRRIVLPLPAAAAAALAILALALALGLLSARSDLRRMSIRRGPAGTTEVEVAAPVKDLERLLRSLDQRSPSQEVIITLPSHSNLILMGQPRLLRAADFGRVSK
jgi:anti-sigma factor RsiW